MSLKYRKEQYPFVIPDLKDWPIVKLTNERDAFLTRLTDFVAERIHELYEGKIAEEIEKTMFSEQERMKNDPWRIDPPSEKKFWKKVRKDLLKQPIGEITEEQKALNDELLKRIIRRYAEEIAGSFNTKTYWFARRFLTTAFTRLLNASFSKDIVKVWNMRRRLQEHIQVMGEIEHIRGLVEKEKGTIVLLPTHFSNLDSILIGLSVDFIGLPAFSYGAGLNLFNSGFVSYFMNRLGSYRVDRRKKSTIYIETLKAYSNLTIGDGVHSLFFPGGTRARSGQIEKRLKLGLLNTAVEGQRRMYQEEKGKKVFIVPLTLGYHFVLEGKSLIEQHLKRTGKEQYYSKDEFRNPFKILQFLWRFFSKKSEIILSFGKPMDVLGNFVDENGVSHDKHGNVLDTKDYFKLNGKIDQDLQRERVYTQILSEKVVKRFYAENVVLSSHIVAYAAFTFLQKQHPKLDIYNIIRISFKDIAFESEAFKEHLTDIQQQFKALEAKEELKLLENSKASVEELIKNGLSNMGIYHDRKPLYFDKKSNTYKTHSLRLLYYYHNHAVGYL